MMEILFRGKRLDNGEWVYGDLIHYDDMSYKNGSKRVFIVEKDCRLWDILEDGDEVDPTTVGQFTGRLDKYGRKIFDGDLVKTCPSTIIAKQGFPSTVIEVRWGVSPSYLFDRKLGTNRFYKIIGNIYDTQQRSDNA